MEALRHQQDHEHKLASLRQDKAKKKLTFIAAGVGVTLIAVVIGGGVAIKNKVEENERIAQENVVKQQQLDEQKKQLEGLQHQLQENEAQARELERQVKDAKSDAERDAAKATASPSRRSRTSRAKASMRIREPRTERRRQSGTKAHVGGGGSKPCNCQPGDPLCSCL